MTPVKTLTHSVHPMAKQSAREHMKLGRKQTVHDTVDTVHVSTHMRAAMGHGLRGF